MVKQDDERKLDRKIGRRLHELRISRGMKQSEVSEAVGVTFQQLQKYERGVNMASPWKLARLADILGVPVASFFDAADVVPKARTEHHTRMMALMRRLGRIDSENPEAFKAICDLAKALDTEKD